MKSASEATMTASAERVLMLIAEKRYGKPASNALTTGVLPGLAVMDLERLEHKVADLGEPAFRSRQVWSWAARGAAGYQEMTDLPAALREELGRSVPFSTLTVRSEQRARDGTVKALFATGDERPLEAVLMRFRDGRRSLCVSSQSGCPLTCRFCATGSMRFARNLTSSEILDQALHFRRQEAVDHCVFMGMGEPMLNLDAVLEACERLPALGVTHRRTTISTVGWIPGIQRLAECAMPVRLALSLHAAEDALRSELMPVNERFPLAEVIEACREFYARRRRRVFVEYVMLAGVNDRYEQAVALARLLASGDGGASSTVRGGQDMFKVNLIPYNPTGSPFTGSSPASIAAFRDVLASHGVRVTVRLTRGRDIAAACGQLAADEGGRGTGASLNPVAPPAQR
jgi:23S rRNA (adenine2503-C2)-methyltransferase